MKDKFSVMKKKLSQKGITLVELMTIVSLMGFIFVLGMYPILAQIRSFRAERAELALFDDADLAVLYITQDAMMARSAVDTPDDEIRFTIVTNYPDTKEVRYHVIDDTTHLERIDSNTGQTFIITRKIDVATTPPTFNIDPDDNTENHRLRCSLTFQDPDNPTITAERSFEVMLRCRDASL